MNWENSVCRSTKIYIYTLKPWIAVSLPFHKLAAIDQIANRN